ncbi:hypothetical protein CsSME_00004766 [Camellia sinensis var. sinensis]
MERLRGVLMSIEMEDDKELSYVSKYTTDIIPTSHRENKILFLLSNQGQFFRGSHEQQAQPSPQEIPTNSWYPSFVVSSPSSSRPTTPSSTSSSSFSVQRPVDRPESQSHVSPAMAVGIIVLLKDKKFQWVLIYTLRIQSSTLEVSSTSV